MDPRFFRKYLDILSERVTQDPATGQFSDPRMNPDQEAYDIQKQKYNIGIADPDAPDEDPTVGPAAQKWQKQQKSMAYSDRGVPLSVNPVRDTTGVTRDTKGNVVGYRDTSNIDYDAAGNPARPAGVQTKIPPRY